MGALVSRRVRRTQPSPGEALSIDWSNPITRDMTVCLMHADQAYGYANALDANNSPVVSTAIPYTAGAQANTVQGTGGRPTGAAKMYGLPAKGAINSPNYSLFAFGTCTSTSVIQSAIDMDNSSPRYFQFRVDAGKVDFIPFNTSAGNTGRATSPVAMTVAEMSRGFTIGATASPTRTAAFQNGVLTVGGAVSNLITPGVDLPISIGARITSTQAWGTGALMLVAIWTRTLTDAEMQSLAGNPWQLFKPQAPRMWLAYSAPSGNSASLGWAEVDDAVSLAGALADPASLGWTEADDAHALSATLTDRVSAAWTEADDSVTIAASIADNTVSAGVAWTEADDSVSVIVTENDSASLSWTEQDDVVAMSGSAATPAIPVDAAIGWTEQDDGFSAFMQVATGGAPGYDVKRKRYVVRKGGQLLVFTDPELAKQALHADDEPETKQYPAKKQVKVAPKPAPKPEPVPEQRVDLNELRVLAEKQHAEAEYKRLLAKKQYETMLTLLERLREEEEDDWLLMSAD